MAWLVTHIRSCKTTAPITERYTTIYNIGKGGCIAVALQVFHPQIIFLHILPSTSGALQLLFPYSSLILSWLFLTPFLFLSQRKGSSKAMKQSHPSLTCWTNKFICFISISIGERLLTGTQPTLGLWRTLLVPCPSIVNGLCVVWDSGNLVSPPCNHSFKPISYLVDSSTTGWEQNSISERGCSVMKKVRAGKRVQ